MHEVDEKFKALESVLPQVLAGTPAAFAYVFGSVAARAADGESDIDIAIGFNESFSDRAEQDVFIDSLVEPLASALDAAPEKIDIKNFGSLPLAVRYRVVRNGKLVYLKDVAAQRLQALRAMREYDDEKPFFDMANKAFFKHYVTKIHE